MFADCLGHGSIFTKQVGVLLTHDTLQFVELTDHTSHQVELVNLTSASQLCLLVSWEVQTTGDNGSQSLGTARVCSNWSQLSVEWNNFQLVVVEVDIVLLILVVEELSVFQTSNQHLLVTGNHVVDVFSVSVTNWDKVWQQSTVSINHVEETLVLLHWRNQHFVRNFQVTFVETTSKGRWVFNDVVNFFKQIIVNNHLPVVVSSDLAHLCTDVFLTCFSISLHENRRQSFFVLVSRCDFNIVTQEAVSTWWTTSCNTQNIKWHNLIIQQCNHPTNWTNVFECVTTPLHRRWERHCLNNWLEACQNSSCWLSSFELRHINVFVTVKFLERDVVCRHTLTTYEPLGSLWVVTFSVQSSLLSRSLYFFSEVFSLFSHTWNQNCQTTWRWEWLDWLVSQTLILHKVFGTLNQLVNCGRNQVGRNFFQTNF